MQDNRALKKDIDRIKKFFVFIGDRGSQNLKMELDKLSESIMQYLFKNPEGSLLRNVIKQELVNCICCLTAKSKIYAVFVYLIFTGSDDYKGFIEGILDEVFKRLRSNFRALNSFKTLNILRFLAETVNLNLLHHFTFLTILNEILSASENLNTLSKNECLLIISKTLPFVTKPLVKNCQMEFKNFLEEFKRVYESREAVNSRGLWLVKGDQMTVDQDALTVFYNVAQEYIGKEDNCDILDVGYGDLIDDKKVIKTIRKTYELGTGEMKGTVAYSINRAFPEFLRTSFMMNDGVEGPENSNIILLRDLVFDLIFSLQSSVVTISAKLLYFSSKYKEIKAYHFACDYLFNLLIKASTQKQDLVFISSLFKLLLTDDQIGKEIKDYTLNRFKKFFSMLHMTDVEVVDRFVSLFSLMQNNIKIGFEWIKEVDQMDQSEEAASIQKFAKTEILRQLMQLSAYEVIIGDEQLAPIIDFMPDEPKAFLEFSDPQNENNPSYQLIMDKFASKLQAEGMKTFLEENETLKLYNGDIQMFFIKCFIYHSRQSLSHLNVYSDRYESILREYSNRGKEAQFAILDAIVSIWKVSFFNIAYSVHKMYSKELIPPIIVTDWVISRLGQDGVTLGLNKLYMEILKKILRIIRSNKRRFQADVTQSLDQVIEKLEKDFTDLLLHITKEMIKIISATQTVATRSLLSDRLITLISEFWLQNNKTTDLLDTVINNGNVETLKEQYQSIKLAYKYQ